MNCAFSNTTTYFNTIDLQITEKLGEKDVEMNVKFQRKQVCTNKYLETEDMNYNSNNSISRVQSIYLLLRIT